MRMSYATRQRRKAQAKREAAAIAAAKHAQRNRLVETLQGLNEKLHKEYAELATENAKHKADLSAAAQIFAAKSKDIETFKLEALQLTTENAELRGYIGRTLEDDAAREEADSVVDQQDSTVVTQFQQRDKRIRTGPNAMHPLIRTWHSDAAHAVNDYRSGGSAVSNAQAPRHWLNR